MSIQALNAEHSRELSRSLTRKYGATHRGLLYLMAIAELSRSQEPIRRPEDDGVSPFRSNGYPHVPLGTKTRGVSTMTLGLALMKNRRTVTEVCHSLEARGWVVSTASTKFGFGMYWKLTKAGRDVVEDYVDVFNGENGVSFDGFNSRSFDSEGFDKYGVDTFGYNRSCKYVGIHHIFERFYGPNYLKVKNSTSEVK